MSIKSKLAILLAKQVKKQVYKWANKPHKVQKKAFEYLVSEGCKTAYGKDHDFISINPDFGHYFGTAGTVFLVV